MNEVAAVIQRLIEGIMTPPRQKAAEVIAQSFGGEQHVDTARGKLRKPLSIQTMTPS
jgi:hypothetical protein